jgi:hypothetical protein
MRATGHAGCAKPRASAITVAFALGEANALSASHLTLA